MKTIWKYTLSIEDRQCVKMPFGSQILSVGSQYNQVVLWALVEDDNSMVDCMFRVVGTGFDVDSWYSCNEDFKFLGTVLTFNGTLVWHIFQEL